MEVSDERWMTRGLFRLAFPLVSLCSSSSFTNMAGRSKQRVTRWKKERFKLTIYPWQQKHRHEKFISYTQSTATFAIRAALVFCDSDAQSHLLRKHTSSRLVPLFSVSSAAGMFWLYGGKLRGRCGEFVECRTGGLGGTTEKVFGRGGGTGACRGLERREDVSSLWSVFRPGHTKGDVWGFLHWGVCCSLGSPHGSWAGGCWREQIPPGWNHSYTSTSAWRTRSPVWRRKTLSLQAPPVPPIWLLLLPRVSPPAAPTAPCCSSLWNHTCSCRASRVGPDCHLCCWETRHCYSLGFLSHVGADWLVREKATLRFIAAAGVCRSDRLKLLLLLTNTRKHEHEVSTWDSAQQWELSTLHFISGALLLATKFWLRHIL